MTNKLLPALMVTTAIMSSAVEAKDENPFSYTFIEGAYVHDNFDADGAAISDRDGIGDMSDDNFGTLFGHAGYGGAGRVSVKLFGGDKMGFHVVGDFLQTDHKPALTILSNQGFRASGIVDATHSEYRVAGGLHALLSKKVSVFAELGMVNNKADLQQATVTIEGGGETTADISPATGSRTSIDAKLGMRALVGERVELTGFVRYHGNGEVVGGDDGRVAFSSKVKGGVGAFYRFNKTLAVGADYEIGKPGRLRMVARVSF